MKDLKHIKRFNESHKIMESMDTKLFTLRDMYKFADYTWKYSPNTHPVYDEKYENYKPTESQDDKTSLSDTMYSELREEIRNIISSDWANHEDDYPSIEQTADECMETIKKFLDKK